MSPEINSGGPATDDVGPAQPAGPPDADQGDQSPAVRDRLDDEDAAGFLVDADSDLDPVLSVVIPTMNEEEGIATCLHWVREAVGELGVPVEVIVSDSSDPDDRTPEIAAELGAIVVEPDRPGYGYAYRYAFERARGEYLVMGDADTTYDFREIPRLLEPVSEGSADVVMGSRLAGEIEDGAMPPMHRYVGNPLLTAFLNAFYDAGVSDAHSGFRVFHRDVLADLDLQTTGMEFASEMIMAASARDVEIQEVPITYHEREGEETLDTFRDGWRHVRFMLTNAPGYLFSVPGAAMMAVGLLVIGSVLSNLTVGGVTLGAHSVVAGSLLTIAGAQVASFGVFATIASDPIQAPSDPITTTLVEEVRLEHGGAVGLALLVGGGAYGLYLVAEWVASGFTRLPFLAADVVAFTAVVLGLQVLFGSFFFSILSQAGERPAAGDRRPQ